MWCVFLPAPPRIGERKTPQRGVSLQCWRPPYMAKFRELCEGSDTVWVPDRGIHKSQPESSPKALLRRRPGVAGKFRKVAKQLKAADFPSIVLHPRTSFVVLLTSRNSPRTPGREWGQSPRLVLVSLSSTAGSASVGPRSDPDRTTWMSLQQKCQCFTTESDPGLVSIDVPRLVHACQAGGSPDLSKIVFLMSAQG